jgi:hypothetical protein
MEFITICGKQISKICWLGIHNDCNIEKCECKCYVKNIKEILDS